MSNHRGYPLLLTSQMRKDVLISDVHQCRRRLRCIMKNEDEAASGLCPNGREFHRYAFGNNNIRSLLPYLHSTRSLQAGFAALRVKRLSS